MLDFPYQRVPISATYAIIASKAPVFSFTARGWLEEPNNPKGVKHSLKISKCHGLCPWVSTG
jgi:hypothetical protein